MYLHFILILRQVRTGTHLRSSIAIRMNLQRGDKNKKQNKRKNFNKIKINNILYYYRLEVTHYVSTSLSLTVCLPGRSCCLTVADTVPAT